MFLFSKYQEELVNLGISKKTVTYFKNKKSEEEYWTKKHLLDQIIKKALPIEKALYPDYT